MCGSRGPSGPSAEQIAAENARVAEEARKKAKQEADMAKAEREALLAREAAKEQSKQAASLTEDASRRRRQRALLSPPSSNEVTYFNEGQ